MYIDKRGIAPLIATMLLLSFAVSVGVVVMNFGRAQVELQAECPINIGLKFAQIKDKEDICYNEQKKEIKFTLENGVNIKVEGVLVNIVGEEEAKTTELNEAKIPKAGTYIGKVPWDGKTSGGIRQLKITPKIILYDAEQICVEKSLLPEKVGPC